MSARDNDESEMAFHDADGYDQTDLLDNDFDDAEGQIDTGDSGNHKDDEADELYLEDRFDLPFRKNPK